MIKEYLKQFVDRFGNGWNRFWFTPGDPLPLAAIRIGVGLLLLYWVTTFTFDLVRFFGPDGLVSADVIEQFQPVDADGDPLTISPRYLSYLYQFDSATELYVVHGIGIGIVVLFTIGLKTRMTTVLALVVALAYIHRGTMLTSQVEPVLAILLFYLCFGPAGAHLSVDRCLATRKARRNPQPATTPAARSRFTSATVSLRLMQVHLTLMYLMMGLAKLSGPPQFASEGGEIAWSNPWTTGEAVWLLLARPESGMPALLWLRDVPYLVHIWTHAIVLFELAFSVFIWNRTARPLLLGLAILHWGLFALVSGTPIFSGAMLVANLAFFSPEFLQSVLPARAREAELSPAVAKAA